ncbi:MAG: hypothetical protein GY953_42905, partial [bacterium]|nr:hypothetical protein [bacterium]
TVDTPDGLWWIEHADPEDPQLGEFDMPPLVSGAAAAQTEPEPDLDYAFEGVELQGPGDSYFALAAALDLWFQEVGQSTPLKDEDHEVAEIDDREQVE